MSQHGPPASTSSVASSVVVSLFISNTTLILGSNNCKCIAMYIRMHNNDSQPGMYEYSRDSYSIHRRPFFFVHRSTLYKKVYCFIMLCKVSRKLITICYKAKRIEIVVGIIGSIGPLTLLFLSWTTLSLAGITATVYHR